MANVAGPAGYRGSKVQGGPMGSTWWSGPITAGGSRRPSVLRSVHVNFKNDYFDYVLGCLC